MVKRHHRLMLLLFKSSDVIVAITAWLIAYYLYYLGSGIGLLHHVVVPLARFAAPMFLSLILMLLIFGRLALYQPKRTKNMVNEIWDVFRAVLVTWGLTYVITTLMSQAKISRLMMALVLVVWAVLAILNRLAARITLRWFRGRGWNQRSAVIVGTGRLAQELFHTLGRHLWTGINVCYFIGDQHNHDKLFGLDVFGPIDDVDRIIRQRCVDIVFIAMPSQHHSQLGEVLDRLAKLNVDMQFVPDLLSFHFLKHNVTQLDDIPIITITHSPQHGPNRLLKRFFDILISALAIVVMAAPMVIIALLIKLSSRGPVFYRQVRTSLGGRSFRIIKFRTMKLNSEDQTGPVWASPHDSRVTKPGRFLRRSSLDELPQLFNVLVGHMSLVGPRPERPELIEKFRHEVPRYMLRHQVKAGLAGWAQVHGLRGQTSLRKRIQYDLYYISNWSFGLDLRILLMTPFRGIINPNAY